MTIDTLETLMEAKGARDLVRNEILKHVQKLPRSTLPPELCSLLAADEHASELMRHAIDLIDPEPEL